KVLYEYGKIVHDWFRFIEGTIEKIRNRHKSKKASESEFRKNTKKEKQKCDQPLTPKQKICNEPTSERDTQEQASQKSEISIMDLVDKYRSGLRNRPATS